MSGPDLFDHDPVAVDTTASRRADQVIEALGLQRVLRLRWLLVLFIGLCAIVLAGGRGDWNYFVSLGRSMLGTTGLHVYAASPDAQTGPIALVLAALLSATPRDGFVVAVLTSAAVAIGTLRTLELRQPRPYEPSSQLRVLIGSLAVVIWWAQLGKFGHLDDALTLALGVQAALAHRNGSSRTAAALVGVGILIKPWAVILTPLGISLSTAHSISWTRTFRNAGIVVAIASAGWLPFILANEGTLDGLTPTVGLAPDSVLRLIGANRFAEAPWLRMLQLGLAVVYGLVLVIRRRPVGVIAGGVAIRMMLDPGTWSYYTSGLVLGVFAYELAETRHALPWGTLIVALFVDPPFAVVNHDPTRSTLRLGVCLAVVTWLQISGDRTRKSPTRLSGAPS